MNKQLVPYEIAVQLKEKGFDEKYLCFYAIEDHSVWKKGDFCFTGGNLDAWQIQAPLYQQVVYWFHKHSIHIEIYCNASGWGYILTKLNGTTIKEIEDYIFFKTHNEALKIGIEEALKLI